MTRIEYIVNRAIQRMREERYNSRGSMGITGVTLDRYLHNLSGDITCDLPIYFKED